MTPSLGSGADVPLEGGPLYSVPVLFHVELDDLHIGSSAGSAGAARADREVIQRRGGLCVIAFRAGFDVEVQHCHPELGYLALAAVALV
jgi:hypothetical protein